MTDITLLLGLAAMIGFGAPTVLGRQRWLDACPRIGLAAWLAALWATTVATFFAVTLLALDNPLLADAFSDLLRACLTTFHHKYGTQPLASALAMAALGMTGTALFANAGCARWHSRRARRAHHESLDVLCKIDAERDISVIEHPQPTAYCLTGRGGRVVVSSGALTTLRDTQIAAVIAHERAHLAGNHHLIVAVTEFLASALPFLPLGRRSPAAVRHLLERAADERSCREHDPRQLASALRAMSTGLVPPATLGMARGSPAPRLEQLVHRPRAQSRTKRLLAWACVAVVAVLPIALAAGPALGLALADHCVLPPAT